MKLHFSATSPFVRKVLACAIARGIDGRIELLPTNAHASPAALLAANPLSKVPCLITHDGTAVYDSPVICEYLDSIGDTPALFPASGPARLRALVLQALADGIMDAAVLRRGEMGKAEEAGRLALMARQRDAVARALDRLEADPPGAALDIGGIAVACALGYLDFRFGAEPWRPAHPALAAWFARYAEYPALARTAPVEPA